MDISTKKQKFYGGGPSQENKKHKDDIISLGICPKRKLCATGSLGARPEVFIWDAKSKETVGQFRLGRNTRCVSVMCFSTDGSQVFLGDKANEHNVYLYRHDGTLNGTAKTGSDNLNDCAAGSKCYAAVSKDGFLLFLEEDGNLKKKRGTFGGQ